MQQHHTTSLADNRTAARPPSCRWRVRPAPAAPLVAWKVACWRRGIVDAVESLERTVVETTDDVLWEVEPFDLIALTQRKAPVVAQASRNPRQASLHRMLKACDIEPFSADQAHDVGRLLAAAGTSDAVDAHAWSLQGRAASR